MKLNEIDVRRVYRSIFGNASISKQQVEAYLMHSATTDGLRRRMTQEYEALQILVFMPAETGA